MTCRLLAISMVVLVLEACNGKASNDTHDTGTDTQDTGSSTDSHGDSDSEGGSETGGSETGDSDSSGPDDADGDGYVADEDCDDGDASVNPGATEICDGIDDDCDGLTDDDDDSLDTSTATTWYVDGDADGYGTDDETISACEQPAGTADEGGDCDDTDDSYHPGVSEDDCSDSNDYNCDGSSGYADADGDGWAACEDCDDSDGDVSPDASEIVGDEVDSDCDGVEYCYKDTDNDGYDDGSSTVLSTDDDCSDPGEATVSDPTGDCDDTDATINPGATEEIGDEVDSDCDGTELCYADADDDGYSDGSEVDSVDEDCDDPGEADDGAPKTDCDDSDADINPDATEICDAADTDEDCNGLADDDDSGVSSSTMSIWFADDDGDLYGDEGDIARACDAPDSYIALEARFDCDDTDADINPGATEICDDANTDENCNGLANDEDPEVDSATQSTWYADDDDDLYGDADTTTTACDAPAGYIEAGGETDCDDTDEDIHPGATEICDDDDADEDCDGLADDDDPDVDSSTESTWYADADSDLYGDADTTTTACDAPDGYVVAAVDVDCDDTDPDINPGETEVCDAADTDEDCDGLADDDDPDVDLSGGGTYWPDADSDGYGDEDATGVVRCDDPSMTGAPYVKENSDCDDTKSAINPDETEVCDAADTDEDCDGLADDDDPDVDLSGGSTYWPDADGDSYGDQDGTGVVRCDDPSTASAPYATENSDCDDSTSLVNPGATEVCNDLLDNDCDGTENDCVLTGNIGLASADAKLTGAAASDLLGQAVSSAGDVNGDGLDDLLVGTPWASVTGSWAGGAYLVQGPVTADLVVSSARARLYGASASDELGGGVSGAGDVDDDGYDDILVGAPLQDSGGSDAGAAYLWYSPVAGSLSASLADVTLIGEAAYDYAGYAVSGVGDVDDDGVEDVAIGAPYSDDSGSYSGTAYVVRGPISGSIDLSAADAELHGSTGDDLVGYSLAGTGDLDGDGLDDLIIGASVEDSGGTNAGAAYIVLGPMSGIYDVGDADAKLVGEAAYDYAGKSVSGAGDVDGDGYRDVLVGAYGEATVASSNGAAYLVHGKLAGTTDLSAADAKVIGDVIGDEVGYSVSGPGDVDGDGYDDMLVGAPYSDLSKSNGGVAALEFGPFSGTFSLSDADTVFTGESKSDLAGYGVSGAGDQDGDGYADLLVGAIGDDDTASNAGAVYLIRGLGL